MTATGHLELLRQMFPEKFVLDIDEIAMVLGCSKKRLYTLSSKKELPFATLPGFRIQVTMMELARYLDASGAQPEVSEVFKPIGDGLARSDEVQKVQELPVTKKIGRPRKIDSVLLHRGKS